MDNNNNELDLIDLIFDRRTKKFIESNDNDPEQSDNDTPTEVIADDNVVTSGTQQLYPSTPSTRGDNTPSPTNNNVSEVIADDNNTSKSRSIMESILITSFLPYFLLFTFLITATEQARFSRLRYLYILILFPAFI